LSVITLLVSFQEESFFLLPGWWVRGAHWCTVSNQVDGSGGCKL